MQSCKLKKYVGKGSWNWVQGTQNGKCEVLAIGRDVDVPPGC